METIAQETAPKPAVPTVRDERICLSFPVYGKPDMPFINCVFAMFSSTTVVGHFDPLMGDSLVNRARNNIAHRFLEGFPDNRDGKDCLVQFDWLLQIDSDLVFKASDVELIYALGRSRGPGVYAGTYPLKQLKPKVVFNNMPNCVPDAEGVVEVREAGTGFMLIHREVFEKMKVHFADEIRYETDNGEIQGPRTIMYDFFSVGVRLDPILGHKRFLSEDWFFCQRWREMGGKVLMQTNISCGHIGNFTYPGNPTEIMEAGKVMEKAIEKKKAKEAQSQPVLVRTIKAAA